MKLKIDVGDEVVCYNGSNGKIVVIGTDPLHPVNFKLNTGEEFHWLDIKTVNGLSVNLFDQIFLLN